MRGFGPILWTVGYLSSSCLASTVRGWGSSGSSLLISITGYTGAGAGAELDTNINACTEMPDENGQLT